MNRLILVVVSASFLVGCTPGAEFIGDYEGKGTFSLSTSYASQQSASGGVRSIELDDQDLRVAWDGCELPFEPEASGKAELAKPSTCTESGGGVTFTMLFREGELSERNGDVKFRAEGTFVYRSAEGEVQGQFAVSESWERE